MSCITKHFIPLSFTCGNEPSVINRKIHNGFYVWAILACPVSTMLTKFCVVKMQTHHFFKIVFSCLQSFQAPLRTDFPQAKKKIQVDNLVPYSDLCVVQTMQ